MNDEDVPANDEITHNIEPVIIPDNPQQSTEEIKKQNEEKNR